MKIENRTFIISGGASGLGVATALDLHSHGAYIAIFDLNSTLAEALISKSSSPSRIKFFPTDVTSTTQITTSITSTLSWITNETHAPLAGVITAAGIGYPGLILDRKNQPLPLEKFKFVIDINLVGTVDLVRQVLPYLSQSPTSSSTDTTDGNDGKEENTDGERGIIIMVASAAAYEGQSGQLAYSASKGAIVGMTLPMARDLSRYGIRVVTLAPSMFDSPMTENMPKKVKESLYKSFEFPRRPGRPEEFAGVVRAVVENGYLNGEVIRLDGASRMPARL